MSFIFLAFINTKYFVFINTYFSLFTNNNMIMFINDHIMGSNLQFLEWKNLVATFKILIFLLEHILVWVFLVCTDQVNQFRFSPVRKRWYIDVYEQYLLLSFKQFCLLDIHILAFINSYIALFINGVYLPFINNTEFGDVIPEPGISSFIRLKVTSKTRLIVQKWAWKKNAQKVWRVVTLKYLQQLYQSMPWWMQAIIDAGGTYTCY